MNRKLDQKLEHLLLQKSYSDLDEMERDYVAKYFGEETYEEYRQVLLQSKRLFKNSETQVDPLVKENLLAAFNTEQTSTSSNYLTVLAQYSVPLWKVAVAASILLMSISYFSTQEVNTPESPKIVYVHKTDTIYKEVAVVKFVETPLPKKVQKKVASMEKIAQNTPKVSKTQVTKITTPPIKPLQTPNTSTDTKDELQKLLADIEKTPANGRSAADEQALMDLFVEFN